MRRRGRLILILILFAAMIDSISGTAQMQQGRRQTTESALFRRQHLPFFSENCFGCHVGAKAAGGLDLGKLTEALAIDADREKWESVRARMIAGEMPPKGSPRPEAGEIDAVVSWLETEFARADRRTRPDPGRVTARRLNRSEYNNTIRDLLGIDPRPADDFPQDDSGYGFDNIGDVLSLPPVLMEKYMIAAERSVREALFGPEVMKPSLANPQVSPRNVVSSTKVPAEYDRTGLSMPNAFHLNWRAPVEADYVLRVFLAGERPLGSEPIELTLWLDGQISQRMDFDPDGRASFENDRQDLTSLTVEFRQHLTAGEHWLAVAIPNLYEGLPAKYGGPNPSKKPMPKIPDFRVPPGVPPERIPEFKKYYDLKWSRTRPANVARASRMEIGGPYNQVTAASEKSLRAIYSCGHLHGGHVEGCERKIVGRMARRAWRRAVSGAELDRLLALNSEARRRGDSFEEALAVTLQALLVSPDFLFRIERDPATARAPYRTLNGFELASRLSYFIWSSMPDDELLQLAERQVLGNPAVLEAQVRRLLADPKSKALVENFGGQWLELRRLESIKPDTEKFPAFDEYLRISMRRETELFLDSILRGDRPLTDLIDSDYSFVNERLARFYKLPGITGPEFRRVALDSSSERGGVLTQASVLTVSSYSTRTSPVLRGKWILENILNSPPPPPPPGVPALDEAEAASAVSLRKRLEDHRRNPTCASCHARMDPLGFGLENYDAIGGWRTEDGKSPIDSTGVLPNGKSFAGSRGLKSIVLEQREAFVEGLAGKMLTYALGRGLERYDRPAISRIATRTVAANYRPSTMIVEIVRSLPFRNRRTGTGETSGKGP